MFRFLKFFWKTRKGIDDVTSFRFSLHGVILSMGGHPSPKFSRVPLVEVFITICFLRERVVTPLSNPPLFTSGLGTVKAWANNDIVDAELTLHDRLCNV